MTTLSPGDAIAKEILLKMQDIRRCGSRRDFLHVQVLQLSEKLYWPKILKIRSHMQQKDPWWKRGKTSLLFFAIPETISKQKFERNMFQTTLKMHPKCTTTSRTVIRCCAGVRNRWTFVIQAMTLTK